jgi:hypothetical protein
VKPPRRDAQALNPAGMFGGKALLRLAEQKSKPHAPSAPMRSTPAYFLCKLFVTYCLVRFHCTYTTSRSIGFYAI